MWQKISTKLLLDHPRMRVVEDTVQLPDGQITDYIRFDGEGRSVMVVCIVDDKVLVQKEYSYPPNEVLYQFPGGGAHKDESLEEAAIREFAEECKYKPSDLMQLGWFYKDNRRGTSKMNVFLTTSIEPYAELAHDAEEDIELEWIPVATFSEMIREGKIVNYMMLAAWAFVASSDSLSKRHVKSV